MLQLAESRAEQQRRLASWLECPRAQHQSVRLPRHLSAGNGAPGIGMRLLRRRRLESMELAAEMTGSRRTCAEFRASVIAARVSAVAFGNSIVAAQRVVTGRRRRQPLPAARATRGSAALRACRFASEVAAFLAMNPQELRSEAAVGWGMAIRRWPSRRGAILRERCATACGGQRRHASLRFRVRDAMPGRCSGPSLIFQYR